MKRVPRYYQTRAADAFNKALEDNQSALIVHPTAAGKTVTLGRITDYWTAQNKNVLLVAHRVELLDQAADKFADELGYRPQVIQGNRPVNEFELLKSGRAFIASVPTMARGSRRLEWFRRNPIDLLLFDEAHHCRAKTYVTLKDRLLEINPHLKWGGVTATPNRTDKRALGLMFDTVADQIEIAEAVSDGWLVPPCEKKVVIEGVDFADVKLVRNEYGDVDFDPASLAAKMDAEKPLHAVTEPLLENAGDRKWIVFASGVQHARNLASLLNRARPGCAEAMDGENHKPGSDERIRILNDFRNPEHSLKFVCNFGLLTEGTDLPICAGIAIARPTKSRSVLTQMIGRALRPVDGLVDQFATAQERIDAILKSEKPSSLVLYFIPRALNVKVLTVVDALGGNMDEDTTAAAKNLVEEEPGADVLDKIRQAVLVADLMREEKERLTRETELARQAMLARAIKPNVGYHLVGVNGHHREGTRIVRENGMASEVQVAQLTDMGVSLQTALGFGTKQAHQVLTNLRTKRCTNRQRAVLIKYGRNPDVPFKDAQRMIDAIAEGGWKA